MTPQERLKKAREEYEESKHWNNLEMIDRARRALDAAQKAYVSAAAHTPGPWEIVGDKASGRERQVTIIANGWKEDGDIIAETPRRGNPNARKVADRSSPATEQDWANARLIAAAPELLAVLESAASWFGELGSAQGLLNDIRAAIAKAKGE